MHAQPLNRWFKKSYCIGLSFILIMVAANSVDAQPAVAKKAPAPAVKEKEQPAFIDFGGAENDDARMHFDRGKAFFAEEKYEEARAEYEQAWKLRRAADIACNLGNIELMLNKARDAAEHLWYCSRHFPMSGKPEQRRKLDERFAEARARVAQLRVLTVVGGVEIIVDGQFVGRTPLEDGVFVDPGPHRLKGRLSGFKNAQRDIEVKAGEELELRLDLEREIVVAPAPKSEPWPLWPALVAGGVGVAGVGTGVATLLMSNSKEDERLRLNTELRARDGDGACLLDKNKADCKAMDDAELASKNLHRLSIVGFITGGVGLVAGGVLGYMHFKSTALSAAPTTGGLQIKASPLVYPGGGGVWISGSF